MIQVGDVVKHKEWDLCIWEVTELNKITLYWRKDAFTQARIKLLGGQAMPPDWMFECRFDTKYLIKIENEMEILAMSAMEPSTLIDQSDNA